MADPNCGICAHNAPCEGRVGQYANRDAHVPKMRESQHETVKTWSCGQTNFLQQSWEFQVLLWIVLQGGNLLVSYSQEQLVKETVLFQLLCSVQKENTVAACRIVLFVCA